MCFPFVPNCLQAFGACLDPLKIERRLSPWQNAARAFERAAESPQDDLADSEEPEKFLTASVKGEVPPSFQPYVTDALNAELPKKLLQYLVFLRRAFCLPFYSNTEAALATNGFYIWKGSKEPNIWPMTKIFPHHLAFASSPTRHFSFRAGEVEESK